NGIVAKEGTIVDASFRGKFASQPLFATFVNVPKQRNTRDENSDIKKGAIPLV
ncbi:MAG: hypothetical protein IE909_13105, partial [Campylobacterales bacterium]|nr:hypothetical protein [Campylobacterales bacterium]